MNGRNADYIMRWNPRSFFPLVDDKILTKKLAESFQIPTPVLYCVVDRYGDVAGFQAALRGICQFAVKPARGSGGSGIILIRDYTGKGYVTQSGELISHQDILYHISDILSGIYSLSGLEDRAILEALIHPDPIFDTVSYQGVPDIRVVVYRGVPVMGHVGLRPQQVLVDGAFRARGRTNAEHAQVIDEAKRAQAAGAFAVVVEGVAESLARTITQELEVPTIGIGASPACDGQVLVTDDMLGIFDWTPKFVRRYANLRSEIERAVSAYAADVRARRFPGEAETYQLVKRA